MEQGKFYIFIFLLQSTPLALWGWPFFGHGAVKLLSTNICVCMGHGVVGACIWKVSELETSVEESMRLSPTRLYIYTGRRRDTSHMTPSWMSAD